MKKSILFTLLLFMALAVQAQHIKFQGVELGCTIEKFQTQIKAKGFNYSDISKNLKKGTRVFTGRYLDESVIVVARYRNSDKKVFEASIIFRDSDTDFDDVSRRLSNALHEQFEVDTMKTELIADIFEDQSFGFFEAFKVAGGSITLNKLGDSIILSYTDAILKNDEEKIEF